MMERLILIKHSLPVIQAGVPAADWELSETGRSRCMLLASALRPLHPSRLISSLEPKASETARLTAGQLRLPWNAHPNLHEHVRPDRSLLSREDFEHRVSAFFEQPGERVFGEETADQAHSRFSLAVESLLNNHPAETLGIVAHGTVISLFVARRNPIRPFDLWQRLDLPSFVVLAIPNLELIQVVSSL